MRDRAGAIQGTLTSALSLGERETRRTAGLRPLLPP